MKKYALSLSIWQWNVGTSVKDEISLIVVFFV